MRTLAIGRQSAGFIRRGHPWVRRDRFTHGLERLAPGEPVTLVDEHGQRLASALADPGHAICARVYDPHPDRPFRVDVAVERAWQRRASLHQDTATDCYRVVHGEADGLPGLRVERLANVLTVTVGTAAMLPHVDTVTQALIHRLHAAVVVIREHLDDLRRSGPAIRRSDGQVPDPEWSIVGRELGVRVRVRPTAGLATGIYVDQRATRRWLRDDCAGRRVLNLFAYTGLFSMSLLAAGAASATDVDLSAPALGTASDNAVLNGVADRHQAIQMDCLRFLAGNRETFDLVIIDPPTAAQGGAGWVAGRDYAGLLAAVRPRLAPGARVVAISNTVGGKPFDVLGSALQVWPQARQIPAPPLGEDLPQLRGFHEGRPFRLVSVQT